MAIAQKPAAKKTVTKKPKLKKDGTPKAPRKPTEYNLHMRAQMAKGVSFADAAKSWKHNPKNPKAVKK